MMQSGVRISAYLSVLIVMVVAAFGKDDVEVELETIVVTASRIPKTLSETSRSVSVISRDVIDTAPVRNAVGLLDYIPGVDLQSRGPRGSAQADVSIRGSTFEQTAVLIDGVRVNDPQTGHYKLDLPITPNDIERIEVLRGQGSALHGPDAFGGVINIITRRPREKKVAVEGLWGEYATGGGNVSVEYGSQDFGFRASVDRARSDGYRFDTDFDTTTVFIKSTLYRPWGDNSLTLGGIDKEYGAYDFYTPGMDFPSKEWTRTRYVSYAGVIDNGGVTIEPKLFYRRHYNRYVLNKSNPSFYQNRHTTESYGGGVQVSFPLGDKRKLAVGGELSGEEIDSTALGDRDFTRSAVFAEIETPMIGDALVVNLGGRLDHYSTFGSQWSPAISGRVRLSDSSKLRFSVGRSFRVPTFTDLYYDSPANVGDPDLKPEEAWSYEIGIDYFPENNVVTGGVTVFLRDQKDLIDWIKKPPAAPRWTATNITSAQMSGIEVGTKIKGTDWLTISFDYTYLDSDVEIEGNYVSKYASSHPEHHLQTGLILKLPHGILQTSRVTYKAREGGDRYTVTDTRLSKNMSWGNIFVEATNLLNVDHEDIIGVPQPGRWVTSGVRLEF